MSRSFPRFFLVLLLVVFVSTITGTAVAGRAALPRTGQTQCYGSNGSLVACTGSAQDGELQAGQEWPAPRFVENPDGTLTDKLTGLTWLKDANCLGTHYQADYGNHDTVTWEQALGFVAGVNSGMYSLCGAGHTDWRLPNVLELESLWQDGAANAGWLESQGFANVGGGYWSSTTSSLYPDGCNAIFVDLEFGQIANVDKSSYGTVLLVRGGQLDGTPDKNFPANVWRTGQTASWHAGDDGAIRAGVAWPTPRFTDNGDGSVTDNLSGLVWFKDANCIANHYPEVDADGLVDWSSGLAFVAGINDGTYGQCGAGKTDWRLPNRKEMLSLIDFSHYNPALPSGHPFLNVGLASPAEYWTATTKLLSTDKAWETWIRAGDTGASDKEASTRYVWPVRGESRVTPQPTNLAPGYLLLLDD
ncbi:hypothetical protein DSCA_52970 [Desulfosarcina alkanivorans]|uniref:Lcl C-terminal domain-containing protein n=2 Tax=Desulfosarcina alkanivorans TaxID=571177 RepID=A0A5K7Z421_9BACT|nr:hypothetical protein DSCA_52970 [Desulfosarcina alkanivorans]